MALWAGPGGVLLDERGDCPPLFLLGLIIYGNAVYLQYVNTVRDILVNLFSNAIWAWGVLLFTSLLAFLKNLCRVDKMYLIK